MNTKILTVLVVVLLVIIGGYLVLSGPPGYDELANYEVDTTLDGDQVIESGAKLTISKGATLTVNGNLTVGGAIECDRGDLNLVVNGDLVVHDRIACENAELDEEGVIVSSRDINIVVSGAIDFDEDSTLEADGNVQVVDSRDLLTPAEEISDLYDSVVVIPEDGLTVGPFVEEGTEPEVGDSEASLRSSYDGYASFFSIPEANAQGGVPVLLRGRWVMKSPPAKGIKRILVVNLPNTSSVTITDLTISGPPGRNGDDDKGGSCNAKGKNGENAFRFLATAPNISVQKFTLNLGDGGNGGVAETTKDCKPGTALGGNGGKSGNFRMTAARDFQIKGSFDINPGKGGNGGEAIAHGKDGGSTEDGGDARATGGVGAKNKKRLSVSGSVGGTNNVAVGSVIGGDGGNATVHPGTGGAGDVCKKNGGDGGDGTAKGGKGGDASFTPGGFVGRTVTAQDTGGNGGDSNSQGAKGGDGGDCDPKDDGGDGGEGGEATSEPGKGGSGDTTNGRDGQKVDETGGDGGEGGDGCLPGGGGRGGNGNPKGNDGKDGKNLCGSPPPSSGVSLQKVQVIQYKDKYIPIDQLKKAGPDECEDDHWHPKGASVTATDGTKLTDPKPNECGFGALPTTPVMDIEI